MQARTSRRNFPLFEGIASPVAFSYMAMCALLVGALHSGIYAQETSRVSMSSVNVQGDAGSSRGSLSADGRYVAFYSNAGNLVPGDVPTFDSVTCPACTGVRDVFVRDTLTGITVRVSVNSLGVAGNDKSDRPSISSDGRFVTFTSDATNLVASDFNGEKDIFVHDRDTDADGVFDESAAIATTRVSISSLGVESDGRCNMPAISADGRHVTFRSRATNLVSPPTSGVDHIFLHDRQTQTTILVSRSAGLVQGNADSDRPSISSDGRYVAFHSIADNLVPGDTPTYDPNTCPSCTGFQDAFIHDRDPDGNGVFDEGNATIERVSISTGGVAGAGDSSRPKLSADGRYVLFKSIAANLVTGDTNGADDVFVRDRQASTTVRVSLSSDGTQTLAPGPNSGRASVSLDGRHVAFYSEADDLVLNDNNGAKDVFVHDRQTNTTVRVSVGPGGLEGNDASNRPTISASGRFVAFYSDAYNLVASDSPPFDAALCPACTGVRDIFVHDRDPTDNGIFDEGDGTTERVSISSAGVPANIDCTRPSISADGRYVAFRSTADNLVVGDLNGLQDIFVRDRQTGTTVRVSIGSTGVEALDGNSDLPSISGDGRFVAFWSKASNLVPGDDPPYDAILCPLCVGVADIFVHDRDPDQNGIFDELNGITMRASVSTGGTAGDAASDRPWVAADGGYVGFISDSTNLVPGDTNGHSDVFVRDLVAGVTVRQSVSSSAGQGNFGSDRITLSADGRFVGFRSKADNLVVGDLPSFDADLCPSCTGVRDVFLRDRDPDENGIFDEGNSVTSKVSLSSGAVPGDLETGGPRISGDGSVIAMVGPATNLVPADSNYSEDVFVRQIPTSTTQRISVSSTGAEASTPIAFPPDNDDPDISANGRFVAFRSFGVNLVPKDTNLVADIFLHDRDADQNGVFDEPGGVVTQRVSRNATGLQADLDSGGAKISADGAVVGFYSDATNLVSDDTNGVRDFFISVIAGCEANLDCDDGLFCNGTETCDAGVCRPGAPVSCSDGVVCTIDVCNEITEQCEFVPDDGRCDNGLFCDGAETCDLSLGCQLGSFPCPGGSCFEIDDSCGPFSCAAPTVDPEGCRYLGVTPGAIGVPVALRVTGIDTDPDCWPQYVQVGGLLGATPTYLTPAAWGKVYVHGANLKAAGTYSFQADCDEAAPGTLVSSATNGTTWDWGETNLDMTVDFADITSVVDAFRGVFDSTTPCTTDADCTAVQPLESCNLDSGRCSWASVQTTDIIGSNTLPGGCAPDGIIDFSDIPWVVDAFRGLPYPCPVECP